MTTLDKFGIKITLKPSQGALDNLQRLTQLKGLRVNVGTECSGISKLFSYLLKVNGMKEDSVRLSMLDDKPAVDVLLAGHVDAAIFSSAPNSALIQKLLRAQKIDLFDFYQAEAYTHRIPSLLQVTLPRGSVDLGRDQPLSDVYLIALTTTLVARDDLHPALINLFAQAAVHIHGSAGWFWKCGEFPNANSADIPVVPAAIKLYCDGPPLL